MADYYIDPSAIGNEYQAYADTPATWAVPQDGNGKAGPGHSAAVAIATIDVAGCTASGTGTIGVMGVNVSTTLNASGAALATAIASAINASATAVTATYSANLLPVNRLVYARVNPGLSTQVQIMVRIAGTDWNGMAPTQANISPAATIGAFAGGADGPFAYLMNTGTVLGRAAGSYGAWIAASAGVTDPGANDVRHVRTRRSGADLSLTYAATTGTWTWRQGAFLYDNGTVWSGDNGKLTVTVQNTNTGSNAMRFTGTAAGRTVHVSRGYRNLDVVLTASGGVNSSVSLLYPASAGQFGFLRCGLLEPTGNIGSLYALDESGAQFSINDFSGSFVQLRGQSRVLWRYTSASCSTRLMLNGLQVEVIAASGSLNPIASFVNTTALAGFSVQWVGGAIYDTNGVYRCVNPFTINAGNQTSEFEILGVAGVTDPSAGFTATAGPAKLMWSQTEGPVKGYRYEAIGFVADWKGDGTFPECGALNLQGDAWSHRVTWGAVPSIAGCATPMRTSVFHRSAAAARTLTLQLYVPDATTIYTDELDFEVSYLDSTDVWRVESVGGARGMQLAGSGRTALASSAKAWTANGVAAHSAKKIELTTAYPVKQNSEMLVRWSLATSRSPAVTFYVSPQVEIA